MSLFNHFQKAISFSSSLEQEEYIQRLHEKCPDMALQLRMLIDASVHAGDETLGVASLVAKAAHQIFEAGVSSNLIGERLACWRLDSIIAEGGMGIVYLASRQDGQFEQKVAIKVLSPVIFPVSGREGMFAEANFFARLNHACIAKIFDAGIMEYAEFSAHYIVMEYIEGVSLRDWMKSNSPNLKALLTILIKICDALHYAHTRQVAHADVKPENILIDEHGMPKLIDFGISRFSGVLEERNAVVSSYLRAMSINFSSPEQINGGSISTLSDVFSVGKVIEFCFKSFSLNGFLKREIAAIVGVSTAIKGEDRYSSCHQLAQDLIAVRDNRRVSVFGAGFLYFAYKFMRRQPVWTATAVSMGAALLILAGSLIFQYEQLKRETAQKTTVVEFLRELFTAANPASVAEAPLTLQQLLTQGRGLIDDRLIDNPAAKSELKEIIAQAYFSMADFNGALAMVNEEKAPVPSLSMVGAMSLFFQGKYDDSLRVLDSIKTDDGEMYLQEQLLRGNVLIAKSLYKEAIPFLQNSIQKEATNLKQRKLVIQAYISFASLLSLIADYEGALDKIKKSEELADLWLPKKSLEKIELYNVYGGILLELNQLPDAKKYYNRGYEDSLLILGKDHPITATAIRNIGVVDEYQENFPAAIEAYHKAESSYLAHFGPNHIYLGHLWNDLGIVYRYAKNFQKSLEYLEKSEANIFSQFGEKHADLGSTLGNKGTTLYYLKRYDESLATLKRALAIDLEVTGEQHYRTATRYFWLAFVSSRMGNNEEAIEYINKSIDITSQLYGNQNVELIRSFRIKAQILLALGNPTEANSFADQAIGLWNIQQEKLVSEVLPLYYEKILALRLMDKKEELIDVTKRMMEYSLEGNSNEKRLQEFWFSFSRSEPYDLSVLINQQQGSAEGDRFSLLQQLSYCSINSQIKECAKKTNLAWLF